MPLSITTTCSGDAHPELKQQWWEWSDLAPYAAITGWVGREAVAIVRLFDVQLTLPDAVSIECIGFGGVFVKEEHRGKRYGIAIVNQAILACGPRGMPFVLRTRDARLYRPLGFEFVADGEDGQSVYFHSRASRVKVFRNIAWKLSAKF